jgi:hypothetical protein
MSGIASTLLLLAAQPPDPGDPSIISLGATLGGLVGGLVGQLRRLPDRRAAIVMTRWTLLGGECGVLLYLAMYVL